jgi:hypothetical protein
VILQKLVTVIDMSGATLIRDAHFSELFIVEMIREEDETFELAARSLRVEPMKGEAKIVD